MGILLSQFRPTLAVAAIAATLLVAGCAPTTDSSGAGSGTAAVPEVPVGGSVAGTRAALADLGLDAEDPAALVDGLEALPIADRPDGFVATIMPGEIRIQPETPGELVVPIAEDQFYLSVAPYRAETHPCTFHVPTSCVGELRDAEAQLRVTDAASGEVIVDRDVRTADNGFVGVWLPSDGEFVVEATVDGATGVQQVRTGDEDPTCITTLQVA